MRQNNRRMAERTRTEGNVATHEETLALLTEKAREGSTSAMIALERALRAAAETKEDEVGNAIDRILTKANGRTT